jgi:exodeoxyribonuclease VII small subunit
MMAREAKQPELSYEEAIRRLDEILEDIDQSRVPVDELAERVVEAAVLLKRCKGLLTETEGRVRDVLKDLEEGFGENAEE